MDRTFIHPKTGAPTTMKTANIGRSPKQEAPAPSGAPAAAAAVSQAESSPDTATPEPAVDKERAAVARLTPEAMIDEILGLRADLAESKAKFTAMKTERDDLKDKLKEATSGDLGRALGIVQRQRDQALGRINEYMAKNKRMEFRLKVAEKRVKELEETPIDMGAL